MDDGGMHQGEVVAYNYSREDCCNTDCYQATLFEHGPGSQFLFARATSGAGPMTTIRMALTIWRQIFVTIYNAVTFLTFCQPRVGVGFKRLHFLALRMKLVTP